MSLITKESLLEYAEWLQDDYEEDELNHNYQVSAQLKNIYYLLNELKMKEAEALIEINYKHKLFYIVKESLSQYEVEFGLKFGLDNQPIEIICTDNTCNTFYLFSLYVHAITEQEKIYLIINSPIIDINNEKVLVNENESFYDTISRYIKKLRG